MCRLQLVEGKVSSCNYDLVQESDETELDKINPSQKKENTFEAQINIQVVQLTEMKIKQVT